MFELLKTSLWKQEPCAPFLFLCNEIEVFHARLEAFVYEQMKLHGVDKQSMFRLSFSHESLKIWEVKDFFSHARVKPRFAFQVFCIEDISRMTLQAQNSCLKIFEEPWEGNIIILTARSQAGILDTILSRVLVVHCHSWNTSFFQASQARGGEDFYFAMITSHVRSESDELLRYFFAEKYEKEEYISFLRALLLYIQKTWTLCDLLWEIEEDMQWILTSNLQWRYVVDKYIIKIGK